MFADRELPADYANLFLATIDKGLGRLDINALSSAFPNENGAQPPPNTSASHTPTPGKRVNRAIIPRTSADPALGAYWSTDAPYPFPS